MSQKTAKHAKLQQCMQESKTESSSVCVRESGVGGCLRHINFPESICVGVRMVWGAGRSSTKFSGEGEIKWISSALMRQSDSRIKKLRVLGTTG